MVVKRTFFKHIRREIGGSFGRFAAIFAITALGVGFLAALIRNLTGLGSLLAFPGSMVGALLCGLVWKYTKKLLFGI